MNQRSALLNALVMLLPLLIAIPITACAQLEYLHSGSGVAFAAMVTLLGFGAFAVAKGSRFGAGHWCTLGTARMQPWARRAYHSGYACMAFGLVGLLASSLYLH
jgi:hypothetical protein